MQRPASALPSGVSVRPEPYDSDGPRWVVAQAEAELVARYGGLDAGERGLTAAMFDPPTGAFLVARAGAAGPPVGGVGLRAVDARTGQVRRLWVDPARRGRGIGRALMEALEDAARDLGLPDLQLATGDRQPEAVALYEATGWERLRVDTEGRPLPHWHIRFSKRLVDAFEIVCEVEPATTPDLTRVRHQIGVLSPVASAFLIPDNHIGRATVSSVAVAHEVEAMGGRSIACLNARDRNLLGFRRDLLTAAAYGVDQFLFVYGDEPLAGARTSELTVRTMIAEGREYAAGMRPGDAPAMRFGAATGLRRLPAWKRSADFLFVQIGFSLDDLLAWRSRVEVDVPVYAGVIVVPSPTMARNLAKEIPGLEVPAELVERLERDRNAGVDAACDMVAGIRDSGAFEGVHLVPVARYREVAARLERVL